MAREPLIPWQDSAAAGAALFLNYLFFEHRFASFYFAGAPLRLVAFSALCALMFAVVFWLAARGQASGSRPGLPMASLPGRVAYVAAALAILLPLSHLSAATISSAFEEMWRAFTGFPRPLDGGRTEPVVAVVWIGWASWVASRGRAVTLRAATVWAWAGLAILLGSCVMSWRWLLAFVGNDRHAPAWGAFDEHLEHALFPALFLSLFACWLAPTDRRQRAGALLFGVGGGVFAVAMLAALAVAAVSLRIYDPASASFHSIARGVTSPAAEGRWFLVVLTLLPVLRLSASVLREALLGLRVPVPDWIAFAALAGCTWLTYDDLHVLQPVRFGGGFPCAVSGVLVGRGLAQFWRAPAPPMERLAERVGVFAGAGLAAAIQLWNFLHPLGLRVDETWVYLSPGVAALLATAGLQLLWREPPGLPTPDSSGVRAEDR